MKMSATATMQVSLTAVLALAAAGAALASNPTTGEEEFRISVTRAGLDLQSREGAQTLYRRLKAAASQACGPTALYSAGSIQQAARNRTCYNDVLDRAVEKLDNDLVTEIHTS